jgi:hypothetical protein
MPSSIAAPASVISAAAASVTTVSTNAPDESLIAMMFSDVLAFDVRQV